MNKAMVATFMATFMATMMATMMALAMAAPAWGGEDSDTSREAAIRKLGAMRVSVDFRDQSLESAVSYLRDFTGLNLVIQSAGDDPDAPVRLTVRDLPVKSVLKLMLESRGLTATWRNGAIVILPREELRSTKVLRIYDVKSHLMKIQDFPGPTMELASPLGGSVSCWQAGVVVTESQEIACVLYEDLIVELVQTYVGGDSWDDKGSVELVNGNLIVSQSPKVHREIEKFLRKLLQVQ